MDFRKRGTCFIEHVKIFFIKNELRMSFLFLDLCYFVFTYFLPLVKRKVKEKQVGKLSNVRISLDPPLIFDSRRSVRPSETLSISFLVRSMIVSRTISSRSCSALSIEPAPLIIIARNERAVERGLFRPKQS